MTSSCDKDEVGLSSSSQTDVGQYQSVVLHRWSSSSIFMHVVMWLASCQMRSQSTSLLHTATGQPRHMTIGQSRQYTKLLNWSSLFFIDYSKSIPFTAIGLSWGGKISDINVAQ